MIHKLPLCAASIGLLLTGTLAAADPSSEPGRWICHAINLDPMDHGPDGVTARDFNEDGLPDLLVPFEQGGYSRIYWHPGYASVTDPSKWDFIEFPRGGEDAGAGDLDDDGHVDIVINGGFVYFNPGANRAGNASNWQAMTLFEKEARVPIVLDIDGDDRNDLLVAGSILYRCPATDKRVTANWQRVELGKTNWAMNAIPHDMDRDGDDDIVVADRRGAGTVWFEHPDGDPLRRWKQHVIDDCSQLSFMKVVDVDGDGRHDLLTTTKRESNGKTEPMIELYRRTNDRGMPTFDRILIRPPSGDFPKGVNAADYNMDDRTDIFVLPKGNGEWLATYSENPTDEKEWNDHAKPLEINGWPSRTKMDDVIHIDMDGDGDTDVATTEENAGWGVIWFENPQRSAGDLRNGFVNLFDGRTLDQWHAVPKDCASDWSVRDGKIVGLGSANRLAYLVWKDEHLTDFELHLRYRLPAKGNTGVEIRSQPDLTGKRPFQGYHADLGHVGIGDHILGAWDFHFARRKEYPCPRGTRLVIDPDGNTQASQIDAALAVAEVRDRKWNHVRVIARGNHFEFFINGKLSSEFTDNAKLGRLDDGAIALQIHDKGMRVEFTDIWLKRLTAPHPDAIPNSHAAGEVDKPELVPLIIRDPKDLQGIVVDETEAELVGKWQYSTHTPPYVGLGYLHDQKSGKGESSVTFTPDLPHGGMYEIRLSHCYNVRRSTNTPVTIHDADGEKTIRIDQQQVPEHGRLFRSLGTFRFQAGKQGWVRISTEGTEGKYVIADAVQFIPVHPNGNTRSAAPRR